MRVSADVARRIRDGHPWVYRDALQGRQLNANGVKGVDITDGSGRLVGRGIYEAEGSIALRVFGHRRGLELDADHIGRSVERAAALRRARVDTSEDACFRVLAGDSEGVPAINVDSYAGWHVVALYSALAEHYLDAVADALTSTWQPHGIYVQRRYQAPPAGRARPGAEHIRGDSAPLEVVVREGQARFVVDVTAPLGTGIFADMRLGRAAVAALASGRSVLNCFSYTAAFSVVAALNGATSVVSVDSASRAHQRARRNFAENEVAVDEQERVRFVTGDVFACCSRMAAREERFDVVIIDPPTFSSTKGGRPFTALKDYAELVAAALEVLAPGGVLCAASNTAKMNASDFERAIARGGAQARRELLVTDRIGQPPDYPSTPGFAEGGYLKFFVVHAR